MDTSNNIAIPGLSLELDESFFNSSGHSISSINYHTPRYGDGNVTDINAEKDFISNYSKDKVISSQIKKFITSSDESGSPDLQLYPLCRLKFLGRGCSSCVYKSVLINDKLTVVAEKVVVVGNSSNRIQLIRELESLKFSLQYQQNDSNVNDKSDICPYIVNLIDVIPNPRDGTISVCLEYMDGGSLQDIISYGGCKQEKVLIGNYNLKFKDQCLLFYVLFFTNWILNLHSCMDELLNVNM